MQSFRAMTQRGRDRRARGIWTKVLGRDRAPAGDGVTTSGA
jgi:hypothetical protein